MILIVILVLLVAAITVASVEKETCDRCGLALKLIPDDYSNKLRCSKCGKFYH